MDDYTQNEAEQKQSTKCSRELWIQNTAQNLLDCPEIRYFRSFSEDNLLTLHNIQSHWEDNVTEFRNLDIKSRFDLNGNIGCLGIWAPGIFIARQSTTPRHCQQRDHGRDHRFRARPLSHTLPHLDEHFNCPDLGKIIQSSMKKAGTQLITRPLEYYYGGYRNTTQWPSERVW